MAGVNSVAELDNNPNVPTDSLLCGQVINEAYLECYYPTQPDAKRPRFAMQEFSVILAAPIAITIGVTQGSNIVTGSFTASQIGSQIQLGNNYYTYAGQDSAGNQRFVENVIDGTGSYGCTLWNRSTPLSAAIGEVQNDPVLLGKGVLYPMANRGEEYRWKSILYGDFSPSPGGGSMAGGVWPGTINYPVGTPEFYRIENGPTLQQPVPTGATPPPIRALFIVEPMPDQAYNIQMQGWVIPTELVNNSDRPILPGDLSTRVLLPLCREKWALTYKKFTGQNIQGLIAGANAAREILQKLGGGQRDRPIRMSIKRC